MSVDSDYELRLDYSDLFMSYVSLFQPGHEHGQVCPSCTRREHDQCRSEERKEDIAQDSYARLTHSDLVRCRVKSTPAAEDKDRILADFERRKEDFAKIQADERKRQERALQVRMEKRERRRKGDTVALVEEDSLNLSATLHV